MANANGYGLSRHPAPAAQLASVKVMKKQRWIAGSMVCAMALAVLIGALAHRYSQWRSEYARYGSLREVEPLGKMSLAGIHFGACFTESYGGSGHMYCDGLYEGPVGPGEVHLRIPSYEGPVLSLTTVWGDGMLQMEIPLPR